MSNDTGKKEMFQRIERLEKQNKTFEDRITFLEKGMQTHSHVIGAEAIMTMANIVRQDIAQALVPPQPQTVDESPAEEEPPQQEQAG